MGHVERIAKWIEQVPAVEPKVVEPNVVEPEAFKPANRHFGLLRMFGPRMQGSIHEAVLAWTKAFSLAKI